MQIVFHARMAEEKGDFGFDDVVDSICEKMIRRHPHVFGSASERSREIQGEEWEIQKKRERNEKAHKRGDGPSGIMDDVALALPSLMRTEKLGKRAARVGFDRNRETVLEKLSEKTDQARSALAKEMPPAEEKERLIGELLFAVVNLSRHNKVDTELALRKQNYEFECRFKELESRLRDSGLNPDSAEIEQMQQIWEELQHQKSKS